MKTRTLYSLITVLWLLLAGLTEVQAAPDDSRFQEANRAYSQGNYTAAITIYEELLSQYGFSPGLLYNLAGSYAQSGQTGKAVLNYERAAKLAPANPDIVANLKLVREASGLFDAEPRLTDRLVNLLPMHLWLLAGCLTTTLFAGLLAAALRLDLSRRLLIGAGGVTLLTVVSALFAVAHQYGKYHSWVIIRPTTLLISPFDGAGSAGTIQEGRLVRPGKDHDAYLFVHDSTGRAGWVAKSVIEPIVPAPVELPRR